MSKEDNNNNINESSISYILRSTGYLPALTEQELKAFDQTYKDYKFKLSNVSINPDEIMEAYPKAVLTKNLKEKKWKQKIKRRS